MSYMAYNMLIYNNNTVKFKQIIIVFDISIKYAVLY